VLPDEAPTLTFDGFLQDPGTRVRWPNRRLYDAEALADKGCRPIGTTAEGSAALGFHDPATRTWAFGRITPAMATRAAFDALGTLGPTHISHAMVDNGRMMTDTRQIVRDSGRGLITVDAPSAAAVGASAPQSTPLRAGPLGVASPAGSFAAIAVALDGARLTESQLISIGYTTDCVNEGQVLRPAPGGPKPFVLSHTGSAPPSTTVQPSPRETVVTWEGQPLLSIGASGGEFEIILQGPEVILVTEAGGIEVTDAGGRTHVLPTGPGALRIAR
jgi:hypothetical protein